MAVTAGSLITPAACTSLLRLQLNTAVLAQQSSLKQFLLHCDTAGVLSCCCFLNHAFEAAGLRLHDRWCGAQLCVPRLLCRLDQCWCTEPTW